MAKKQAVKYVHQYMQELEVIEIQASLYTYERNGVTLQYFIHKPFKYWKATEVTTGLDITPSMRYYGTRKECEEETIKWLDQNQRVAPTSRTVDGFAIPSFNEIIKSAIDNQYEQGIRDDNGLITGLYKQLQDDNGYYIDKFERLTTI